jgi:phospholipid/cholesterol/gamma-HCH transport system substrate-binding protein
MGAFFFLVMTQKKFVMKKDEAFKWKLGMFVTIGLLLFVATIYFVGKQKNLFGSTFILHTNFKTVSGLKEGNNVRFSGINVGTINSIELITDTSVLVDMVIKNDIKKFIKTDAAASIGSDGLMGDKVLTIYPGTVAGRPVKENDTILAKSAIEMEDIMKSVKTSVDNAGIITAQLAQFTYKINHGNGTLTKLITDEEFSGSLKSTLTNLQTSSAEFARFTSNMNNGKGALSRMVNDEKFSKTLDSTLTNLKQSSKGLSENMEAAKHNFLLKGYFKKKEKARLKKLDEINKQQLIRQKDSLEMKESQLSKFSKTGSLKNKKDSIEQ